MSSPTEQTNLSATKRALLALKEIQSKLDTLERTKTEAIAIIGMGCRFPGGVNSPTEFWHLLQTGVDAITEVPTERWDIGSYYDPNPETPGKMSTRYGGFIQQPEQFDPQFFGISPREAASLDPQQRLLLEVSWEALEYANQVPEQLYNTQMGVFIGICANDYTKVLEQGAPRSIDAYFGTGNALSVAAGRISYAFGLTGSSLAVDTACSSSLVSVHLACQSLHNEECRMAIAGGVNLILSPETTIAFSKAHMMASDGRCKTFDVAADGYVRGEGCGVIVLKRLSNALADGDRILALIRGSAVNQDGPSGGLTVPSGPSQENVIRQALASGKVDPAQISYIEAHGTGTSLGDPIEIGALTSVFGKTHSQDQPLIVGSVKTNIGHLEGAAGIASIIKVVLALQHKEIPPHLHFQNPNPYINWDESPIMVPQQGTPWQVQHGQRLAGVSSFGFSGTNAHIVLEEAPSGRGIGNGESGVGNGEWGVGSQKSGVGGKTTSTPLPHSPLPSYLLTLSAKTPAALTALAQRYQQHIAAHTELSFADICHTSHVGRSHFAHRLSVVAASSEEAREKLIAFTAGQVPSGIVLGDIQPTAVPKVAFLFTGQGSQYVEMGRELYDTQPTFRKALEQCDEILRPYLEHPLLEVLYPDIRIGTADERGYTQIEEVPIRVHLRTLREAAQGASTSAVENSNLLDETAYTQPALFALEYALSKLWQSWGIEPYCVMGHSVGEYVAACIAGVFSLEDGLKLIAARGRLMQALPANGGMVAVMASSEVVSELIAPYGDKVAIAAINGPQSVVVSGEQQAIEQVCQSLTAFGVKTKPLTVSHAFHSSLMEPMMKEFAEVAKTVKYSVPQIKLISNLTGKLVNEEVTNAQYWCNHVLKPVLFASGMQTLAQQQCRVLLEIGPKPTLLGMGRQCLSEAEVEQLVWLPSLRPGQPRSLDRSPLPLQLLSDWQQLLQSLGEMYVQGVWIDWKGFDRDYTRHQVVLPTYPFQRQRYWAGGEMRGTTSSSLSSLKFGKEEADNPTSLSSSVFNLLHRGEIQELAAQVTKASSLSAEEQKLLPHLLSVLAKQHNKQLVTASIQDWLYNIQWQTKTRLTTVDIHKIAAKTGTWLILADMGGVGQALVEHLQKQGHSCMVVYAGESYQSQGDSTWVINPSSAADYQQLLGEIKATSQSQLLGVVHLWSLETASPQLTVTELEHSQVLGCGSVLHLVQTLSNAQEHRNTGTQEHRNNLNLSHSPTPPLPHSPTPPIWLVTRGAQPVAGKLSSVAQAPMWGMGKVVSLEYPELFGGMVDLSPEPTSDEISLLWSEIEDSQGEDHVAYRGTQRYVARLVRTIATNGEWGIGNGEWDSKPNQIFKEFLSQSPVANPHAPNPHSVGAPSSPVPSPDSTYLITGGLGALGLKVAQWLVEQGARHLVLVGRKQPNAEAQGAIAHLEEMGAKVLSAQADVVSQQDMLQLLETVQATMPPLRGIVHAAGSVKYEPLQSLEWQSLETILRPKVTGTWLLHQLTQDIELDFFVVFSSIASVWGSKGQAHYAAANAFLDSFAHYRQAQGRRTLSINWGPWAGGGVATEETQSVLTRMGITALQPEQAVVAFGLLLGSDMVQATVAHVDWAVFKELYEVRGRRPLLDQMQGQPQGEAEQLSTGSSILVEQLEAAAISDRPAMLISYLQSEVGQVLGFETSQLPDPQQGFFDMGMDSLTALELKSRLEKNLSTSLPSTIAFECPTIADLAKYLGREVLGWELLSESDTVTLQALEVRAATVSEVKQLSEDALEASIAEELAGLESLLMNSEL